MGALPEALAEYDETWLRQISFTVRYAGRGLMVDVQSDLTEDYIVATVPAAAVERIPR
ncbi:hypothetical protein TPA0908_33430 [Micromonospora sp. AKA38]|nr:hypothetical protein TPA0908_33430 [Micromonospora sp. AKA38]